MKTQTKRPAHGTNRPALGTSVSNIQGDTAAELEKFVLDSGAVCDVRVQGRRRPGAAPRASASTVFFFSAPPPASSTFIPRAATICFRTTRRSFLRNIWLVARLRELIQRQPDPEAKAGCVLAMGQTMEQVGDYPAAIRY